MQLQQINHEQKMSSREIAELTGKQHKDVMKAIRNMEPAWQKINGRKFALGSYADAQGQRRPEYQLNKTESLYVATKFNDEARAHLVLRWEQLERKAQPANLSRYEILKLAMQAEEEKQLLQTEVKLLSPKADYHDKVLQSKSTYVTTQIAKELGMSAVTLNRKLHDLEIQHKSNGTWVLYAKYQNRGYTKTTTTVIQRSNGENETRMTTVWTEKGRKFIHALFAQANLYAQG
ncbi:phage regulatory protein/antirepressor Ant [Limibacter armeniacum]|uniref:phage regulatory protein/antirepressor Ant n=1 Tax=Limibacter armeniacum TaxID=466084 RepID=UPI002FE626B0